MGNGSLSREELSLLRYKYDGDHNGKIQFEEAQKMAEEIRLREGLPAPLPHDKLLAIFQKLDDNGSGTITFEEFDDAFDLLREQRQIGRTGKGKGAPPRGGMPGGGKPKGMGMQGQGKGMGKPPTPAPLVTPKGKGKKGNEDYDPNENPFQDDEAYKEHKKTEKARKKSDRIAAEEANSWGNMFWTIIFGAPVDPEEEKRQKKKDRKDKKRSGDSEVDFNGDGKLTTEEIHEWGEQDYQWPAAYPDKGKIGKKGKGGGKGKATFGSPGRGKGPPGSPGRGKGPPGKGKGKMTNAPRGKAGF